MSATLPSSALTGWRSAAVRLAAGIVALAVIAGAVALYGGAAPMPDRKALAGGSPATAAKRHAQEHCVQGAVMFHDVRWAAACMVLAEQGRGDGFAECELPDAEAARLYAMLQAAEQRCTAEAVAAHAR